MEQNYRYFGWSSLPAFLLALLLMGPFLACTSEPSAGPSAASVTFSGPRIRAVTLDAREAPPRATLERLHRLGATHLALIPFGFQPQHDVPEIRLHNEGRWYSESDAGIRALARQADSLGLQIILKPHIWIRSHDGAGQRSAIDFPTEAGWQAWEAQYRTFLLHYARLAEAIGAPLLCIGTELAGPVRARPGFWRDLIREVRSVYGGRLTYAANWYDEYEEVPFWDQLDYIGVQAYFPLSRATDPSVEMLRQGWAPHLHALRALQRRTGKPVLFTEIGYRSVHDAAAEPWRWPAREEIDTRAPDYDLQAKLYQAFFERLWPEPWFAGVAIWKWYPEHAGQEARRALDFTPQQKPAEAVIARWFHR